MLKTKLKALDYMYWDKVNGNDIQQFRQLVIWLEDQKIRHYNIQDRMKLRETETHEWNENFEKYLLDVGCPIPVSDNEIDKLEWLIGLAVKLEFEDNVEKYRQFKSVDNKKNSVPCVKSTNPLDLLNFEQNDFVEGVKSLAQLLKISQHPDHFTTLDACGKYITYRLNPMSLKNPNTIISKGTLFPINAADMGFDVKDKILNNTAKALNLLHIQDLRNLQTSINETIIAVQNITANPKTDTKVGKVGT